MNKILWIVLLAMLSIIDCGATTHLKRNFKSGVNTAMFDKMFNDLPLTGGTNELHNLIVIKDGKIIYERYDQAHSPKQKHILWSASKTFTATAIGFAVQEGLLSVQDPVIKFFSPEELPAVPSDTLKRLTVWHLLTMSSGFEKDPLAETESLYLKHPASYILNSHFVFEPGTKFKYSSISTYLLSAIITKVTKQTTADYLKSRLFKPLGITDYYWKESAEGYSMGGWGLFLLPEDLAKMGLWMLQRGNWKGKQLMNPKWFDEAMSVQIMQSKGLGKSDEEVARLSSTDEWQAGYGYQMWHCTTGNAFRIDGAWGQLSIICPEKNAVITVNGSNGRVGELFKLIWKNVYSQL